MESGHTKPGRGAVSGTGRSGRSRGSPSPPGLTSRWRRTGASSLESVPGARLRPYPGCASHGSASSARAKPRRPNRLGVAMHHSVTASPPRLVVTRERPNGQASLGRRLGVPQGTAPRPWVLASWPPCRASSTLSVTDRGSGVAEPVAPMDANGPGSHTGVVDGGHDEPLASDLRCAACPVGLGLDVRSEATQAGVGRRHLRRCPPKAEPRGRHGLTPRRRVLTDQPEGAPLGSRCGTVDRERPPAGHRRLTHVAALRSSVGGHARLLRPQCQHWASR